MSLKRFSIVAAIAAFGATASSAAVIEYQVTSTASGTLNGQGFNGDFTITALADTATQGACQGMSGPIPGCLAVVNDSLTLDIAGLGSIDLTNPSFSFVNNASNLFGFSELISGPAINTFAFVNIDNNPSPFATWDGISDLPSFTTTLDVNRAFAPFVATEGGELVFDFNGVPNPMPATFSASLISGAVPEPGAWLMMIVGFGAIGGAMRRNILSVRYNHG